MKKLGLLLTLTLIAPCSYAGLTDEMNKYFESSGGQSNMSGPGAYKGQTAGLYTGGQLYSRNRVRNIYPANIRLPSYSAGCGGIDAFTGSFSFISGDELVKSMESIASNATTYAFMLGMETISPQIEGVMSHLSDLSNAVNRANINSCEAASSLVGGIWPKTAVAQNHICTATNSSSGFVSDWAKAKQDCRGKNVVSTVTSQRAVDQGWAEVIAHGKNIAWSILKKNNKFIFNKNEQNSEDLNNETKELLMSISGTYIVSEANGDSSKNALSTKPSLAVNPNFIKAMIYGGTAKVYKCGDYTDCLSVTEVDMIIPEEKSFKALTTNMINSIKDKIIDDRPLSKEEISFLGSTSLPIYHMMNVQYGYGKDSNILAIESYADLIASDILIQYLSENLEIMRYGSESLLLMDDYMDAYRKMIDRVKANLNEVRNETGQNLNKTITLIQQTQLLEQALAGRLSSHMVDVIGVENGV